MLNINEVSTPPVSASCLQLNEQSYARATCLLSLLSYPHPRCTVVFLFKLYLMCCFRTASAPTPTPELCPLLLLCHASQMSFTFSLYPPTPHRPLPSCCVRCPSPLLLMSVAPRTLLPWTVAAVTITPAPLTVPPSSHCALPALLHRCCLHILTSSCLYHRIFFCFLPIFFCLSLF